MGFDLAISVVVGLYLGYRLDAWLGSEPVGLFLGVFGGLVGAVLRLMKYLRAIQQSSEDDDA